MFAQAIAKVEGAPAAADAVDVVDAKGQFVGRGYWSPKSAIPVRILSRREGDPLDAASLGLKLEAAYRRRREVLGLPSQRDTGYRLVHSEGDELGGLIVDVYDDVAMVQLLTLGMRERADALFAEIARVARVSTVIDTGAKGEGEASPPTVVRGPTVGALRFRERGFDYELDLEALQKTGFYLDQRENRDRVEALANGRRVLDAFSFVGSFSLAAARGGATEVIALDSSATAIATAATLTRRHHFEERIQLQKADVKRALPEMAQRGERFDLVILDPPKLVPTARHLEAGRAAYKRLNANGLRLVREGGLLVTCSCSAAMREEDFMRTVALAAREVGRTVTRLWSGSQGGDHPVPAAFPEGIYLKALFLEVR